MTIAFRCPKCQSVYRVDDSMGGTQAKCKCGATLNIPRAAGGTAAAAGQPGALAGQAAPQPVHRPAAAPAGTQVVTCPGCGKQHQAPASMAGQAAKCQCGAVVQIPAAGGGGQSSLFDDLGEAFTPAQPQYTPQQSADNPFSDSPGARPKSESEVLAQYGGYSEPKYTSSSSSGGGMPAWAIYLIIIVVINLITIPLFGVGIIPK